MCGRHYIDDDTAGEIEKLVRQVDEKMRKAENIHLRARNIYTSELAPVITADNNNLRAANESMKPIHDKIPLLLERRADFEQMSLFDTKCILCYNPYN